MFGRKDKNTTDVEANETPAMETEAVAVEDVAVVEGNALAEVVAYANDKGEMYAFDLPKDLLSMNIPAERLALDLNEAWDLSVALMEEITARKNGAEAKPFVILVNEPATLLNVETPENPVRYAELRSNLQVISVEGPQHDIEILSV